MMHFVSTIAYYDYCNTKIPVFEYKTDKSQITLNYVCMDGNGCWIGWFMNLGYQKEKEQC